MIGRCLLVNFDELPPRSPGVNIDGCHFRIVAQFLFDSSIGLIVFQVILLLQDDVLDLLAFNF